MRTSQDFIDDVISSVSTLLTLTINSVEALAMVDIGGKEELKVLDTRLRSALAIMDGTLDAKDEAEFLEERERWELTPEESKLTEHRDKIIKFLQYDIKKTDHMMADELGVDQSTLAGYIRKRIQP